MQRGLLDGSDGRLRIGLIGCGRLAAAVYAPALASLDGVRLAAVADPDHRRAKELAIASSGDGAVPGGAVTAHRSADELIDAGRVDAIVVCSPARAHPAAAASASAAGMPCLVEKPPAADPAGALTMAALASPPWIGFNRRFMHPPAMRGAVPRGGPIELQLEIAYRRASWRPYEVSDDALEDLGTHLIDLTRWLSGEELEAARCRIAAHDRAELELIAGRATARLRLSTNQTYDELVHASVAGETIFRHRIGGRRAAISARLRAAPSPLLASVARQLTAFRDAARNGDPGDLATADDGVAAMSVLAAARRSAAEGGVLIHLGHPPSRHPAAAPSRRQTGVPPQGSEAAPSTRPAGAPTQRPVTSFRGLPVEPPVVADESGGGR